VQITETYNANIKLTWLFLEMNTYYIREC